MSIKAVSIGTVFVATVMGCGGASPKVKNVDQFVDIVCAGLPALEAAGIKGEAYEYLERACAEGVDAGAE